MVAPGDDVEISFSFDSVDAYTSGDNRAKVTSTSDPTGEWVGIAEVVKENLTTGYTDVSGEDVSAQFTAATDTFTVAHAPILDTNRDGAVNREDIGALTNGGNDITAEIESVDASTGTITLENAITSDAMTVSYRHAAFSATSGLFIGSIELSGHGSAAASGDGRVWVNHSDTLSVTVHRSDGTVIDADSVTIDECSPTLTITLEVFPFGAIATPTPTPSPTPTPTPMPTPTPTATAIPGGPSTPTPTPPPPFFPPPPTLTSTPGPAPPPPSPTPPGIRTPTPTLGPDPADRPARPTDLVRITVQSDEELLKIAAAVNGMALGLHPVGANEFQGIFAVTDDTPPGQYGVAVMAEDFVGFETHNLTSVGSEVVFESNIRRGGREIWLGRGPIADSDSDGAIGAGDIALTENGIDITGNIVSVDASNRVVTVDPPVSLGSLVTAGYSYVAADTFTVIDSGPFPIGNLGRWGIVVLAGLIFVILLLRLKGVIDPRRNASL